MSVKMISGWSLLKFIKTISLIKKKNLKIQMRIVKYEFEQNNKTKNK